MLSYIYIYIYIWSNNRVMKNVRNVNECTRKIVFGLLSITAYWLVLWSLLPILMLLFFRKLFIILSDSVCLMTCFESLLLWTVISFGIFLINWARSPCYSGSLGQIRTLSASNRWRSMRSVLKPDSQPRSPKTKNSKRTWRIRATNRIWRDTRHRTKSRKR